MTGEPRKTTRRSTMRGRGLRTIIRRGGAFFISLLLLCGPAASQDERRVAAESAEAQGARLLGLPPKAFFISFRISFIRTEGVICRLDELRKAVEKFEEALPLWRALGNSAGEARALTDLGRAHDLLDEKQKALDYYSQALPLWRALDDRRREALVLCLIGSTYDSLRESQKAVEYFSQALPLIRLAGDRRAEAETLRNTGLVYETLGEKQKALDSLGEALQLWRAAGERAMEVDALSFMGWISNRIDQKQKAIDYYSQALQISRETGNRRGEADMLGNIGRAYESLGEKQEALGYYVQSLPLFRAMGDRRRESDNLKDIGVIYLSIDRQKAVNYLGRAVRLSAEVAGSAGTALMLREIGTHYDYLLNDKREAINYYKQSLDLFREVGDRRWEMNLLDQIGMAYAMIGEKRETLNYYHQGLSISRAAGDRPREASFLAFIGNAYSFWGDRGKALEYYLQALQLQRDLGDPLGEARLLYSVGGAYDWLGQKQKALDNLSQALQLSREAGDRNLEAAALLSIGGVRHRLGEKQSARDSYDGVLQIWRDAGDRSNEASVLYTIAQAERNLGDLMEARSRIEAALEIVESVRAEIALEQLRTSYFASVNVRRYYEFYIDLLMRLDRQRPSEGHAAEALHASEQARARSLLETLTEARTDIRQGVDAALLRRERVVQLQLNAAAERQARLHNGKHTPQQAEAAKKEVASFADEYRQVRALIRQKNPRYAALTQPVPLSLQEIQTTVLDADTLLLEYALGEERSYLWAVTQTSISGYELPKRAEIEEAVRRVYQLLNDRRESAGREADWLQYVDAAGRLSQTLLSPVAAQLGTKRLVIVSDGALQYLPFGALLVPADIGRADADQAAKTFTVPGDAGHEWQDTGINLQSGALVRVMAAGQVDVGAGWGVHGPEGTTAFVNKPGYPAQTRHRYGLVARLTASRTDPSEAVLGEWAYGDEGSLFRAPRGGRLWLTVNDDFPRDNTGGFVVKVSATPAAAAKDIADLFRPLVADHEIVSLPSASTIAVLRRETGGRARAAKAVAVLADPVFDRTDERVAKVKTKAPDHRKTARGNGDMAATHATSSSVIPASQIAPDLERAARGILTPDESGVAPLRITRLPFTRREAEAILASSPAGEGMKALDFWASRETATGAAMAQYRIVHFAIHGLLNNEHPELSGVVLSLVDEKGSPVDGFLRLHEIYNLNLPAELVVLSACQTALGKEIRGEGLVGLTRGFMYAGAPRVMASLWKVDDVATSELMKIFYRGMLGEGMRPAAALRAAQVEMWKQKRWREPYYWAAFQLQGEWK